MADQLTDDESVHRIVTGMLVRGGRCLLVHRTPQRQWYPDSWDLPGGHVEPGESDAEALSRELLEELGVRVEVVGEPLARVVGTALEKGIWVIDDWEGEPLLVDEEEHDALAWLNHRELGGLQLADPRLAGLVEAALT